MKNIYTIQYPEELYLEQPELGIWMIKFKGKFLVHNNMIWDKCIRSSIYIKAVNLMGFKRYSKFYLQEDPNEEKVCWRVEAVDAFSTDGVLEVVAVEYYANESEDDRIIIIENHKNMGALYSRSIASLISKGHYII